MSKFFLVEKISNKDIFLRDDNMDTPNQVFRGNETSYRYMAYPLQQQPLQTLYPGRFMEPDYHYTGDNIPNEDLPGAIKTQQTTAALAKAAEMQLEAFERHLGGRPKTVSHPAVEPEVTIEDPQLRSLTLNVRDDAENLKNVPSPLDSLSSVLPEPEYSKEYFEKEKAPQKSSSLQFHGFMTGVIILILLFTLFLCVLGGRVKNIQ